MSETSYVKVSHQCIFHKYLVISGIHVEVQNHCWYESMMNCVRNHRTSARSFQTHPPGPSGQQKVPKIEANSTATTSRK